ncbi:MAG: DUF3427 domain-containing protein [Thermoleophilia bacterium]|nr:DUF3427 domain-containing protein [Thermoleophilia bacterium]
MIDQLRPGLRDELITSELNRLLADLPDERIKGDALRDGETIERLGRHLLRIARRLQTPAGAGQVEAVTEVVNRAIASLDPSFADDEIALPPRLLNGIVPPPRGAETPVLPPSPSIPLATTELLVNGDGQPTLGQLLLEELRCADHVDLICAFVGWTGVAPLRDELRALVERGGTIRVVTSTYLGATSRKAIDELVKLGAHVRIRYDGNATKLHAKSWLFHRPGELDTAYIGSSNLSQAALHDGIEWNVRLARADAPAVFSRMQATFDTYWNDPSYEAYSLADGDRLAEELLRAKGFDKQRHTARSQREIDELTKRLEEAYAELAIRPRPHQQEILDQLELRREAFDEHRHLVVAATGTGKTVVAALDYARMCTEGEPRPSLLFVAHREQILAQSLRTFQQVLRDPSFGEILGGSAGNAATGRHVFAMVQTLAQPNRLDAIDSAAYDIVYIDEAHHGAAESWQRVIGHFAPREIVGLTATPERSDGVSVASLFGGAYTTELRLWEAVDDQLLAPFNYIGVDDGTDLRQLAWRSGDYAVGDLANLYTSDHRRVKAIVEAVRQWVEQPAKMRALGFCVNKQHAQFMSEQFNQLGFNADFLTGDDEQSRREAVLSQLKAGELQVVFSVDVLGEGVDVPDVDTLLLLRPTQSPVLFAQQLGRGLRQSPGKTSCTVLDFIGQHHKDYRFDRRYQALVNRRRGSVVDQARRGFPFLPAGSSITLDRIARERVIAGLEAHVAGSRRNQLVSDLREGGDASIERFLDRTGRSVSQIYKPHRMSWTTLQREANSAAAIAAPTDPELADLEQRLLRRIAHLQHVTDPLRVNAWTQWLEGSQRPDVTSFNPAEQRMAVQLMHLLLYYPSTVEEGLETLWELPAVRDEICQLLRLDAGQLDATPKPLLGLPDVPLQVHARYHRDEVFAALGISSIDKRKEHREGVFYARDLRTQLMFVTLHKDEQRYAPSVQYRDHAISRELFHWESPNNWRQTSNAMKACAGIGPDASQHRLLFVREASTGWTKSRFRLFGEVDLDGELIGERPVAIAWRLRCPLPEVVFGAVRIVSSG